MMAWKKCTTDTDVTVDLGDFGANQILQELIDRDYITDVEAEMILNREDLDIDAIHVADTDANCIDTAWEYASRGDRNEALIWIERALGGEWIGRLADV